MTEVANPAVQTMLEQQQKIVEAVEKLGLKTVFVITLRGDETIVQADYNEIAKLKGAYLEETATGVHAGVTYERIRFGAYKDKGDL